MEPFTKSKTMVFPRDVRVGHGALDELGSVLHDLGVGERASIKEDSGSSSKRATTPVAIVADTEIIVKAPFRSLTAGCADAISNGTAVLDWKLAHRLRGEEYSSFAANLAESAAEMILQ